MEQKKKQNLSDKEKERIYDHLVELVRTLDKKQKYKHRSRDDLEYYGIKKHKIYLMVMIIIIMITANQYQLKVLLKTITNIMKAEDIKTNNYQ